MPGTTSPTTRPARAPITGARTASPAFSDDQQRLCFALALWNGKDPILKERLFGLTNSEGNHGEDVKEYYFYLDSTPTHSYMKYLYKYPQSAYPYGDLIETNRRRGRNDMEYELLDTGIFNDDRYFDVFVEYAKASAEDILIQISVCNRGPEAATLHVLPTLWFRNTWTWWPDQPKPSLRADAGQKRLSRSQRRMPSSAAISCIAKGIRACCSPKTRPTTSGSSARPTPTPYVKDGINDYVVAGRQEAVNPNQTGTKAAAHYQLDVGAGRDRVDPAAAERCRVRWRSVRQRIRANHRAAPARGRRVLSGDHACRRQRRCGQCDAAGIGRDAVEQAVFLLRRRQMARGTWRRSDAADARQVRNREWFHMINDHVISMPDKWEYPWFAAWDLAFHTHRAVDRRHRFRQAAARSAAAASSTCIRPGRSRPTSGTSATSTRRCRPGRRSFSTGRSRRCAARPISIS